MGIYPHFRVSIVSPVLDQNGSDPAMHLTRKEGKDGSFRDRLSSHISLGSFWEFYEGFRERNIFSLDEDTF